jgi:hypothetical protein
MATPATDAPATNLEQASEELIADNNNASTTDEQEIPPVVKDFLGHFHKHLYEGTQYDIQAFYETNFSKLTERYYVNSPWPTAESIAQYVNNGMGASSTRFILLPTASSY